MSSKFARFHAFALLLLLEFGLARLLHAQVIVHETFTDSSIEDNSPAIWASEQHCFVPPCGEAGPLTYEVGGGAYSGDWSGYFLMQQLIEVEGQDVAIDNHWSVRSRQIASYPPNRLKGSIALGVGLNSWFHVNLYTPGFSQKARLAVGLFGDIEISNETFPLGEEYVVQMDVDPTTIVGTIWPADDPSKVFSMRREMQVSPARPAFFGDFNTLGTFREIIVSSSTLPIGGDFDGNGLGISDLDALMNSARQKSTDPIYNLNSELAVNEADVAVWIKKLKKTWFGDANLDGEFESGDLVLAFSQGTYNDDLPSNATWASGDWNVDGDFDSADLIVAFQDGGYGTGPRAVAVPEPSGVSGITVALLALLRIVKRPRRCRERS